MTLKASRSAVLGALLLLGACPATRGPGPAPRTTTTAEAQSASDGWRAFCRITRRAQLYKLDRGKRLDAIEAAGRKHVHNKAVRNAVMPADNLAGVTTLRAAQRKAKVASCALVDYLARNKLARRCRSGGDAAVCLQVARLYAHGRIYPGEERAAVPLYLERACINGSAQACATRAARRDGGLVWWERACRRGHKPSCKRLAAEGAPPKITLVKHVPGEDAVTTRVKQLYQHSVVDCFEAYAQRRTGNSRGRVAFKFKVGVTGVTAIRTNAFDSTIALCLKQQMQRWAFPKTSGQREYRFCYELSGKSMISRRAMPLPVAVHLLSAPGRRRVGRSTRVQSSRRVLRVARRVRIRGRYPWVSIYTPSTRGATTSLSRYHVRTELMKHKWHFNGCFKTAYLKGRYSYSRPTARPRFNITVDQAGKISAILAAGGAHNATLRGCMKRVLRGISFKPPTRSNQPATAGFQLSFYFYTSYRRQTRPPICEFSSF